MRRFAASKPVSRQCSFDVLFQRFVLARVFCQFVICRFRDEHFCIVPVPTMDGVVWSYRSSKGCLLLNWLQVLS